MNYHQIEECSISNGTGFRTVLYVSGCSLHCKGCFNEQTWDKESGKAFDEQAKNELFDSLNHPYSKGLTVSGGHPLEPYNIDDVLYLLKEVKRRFPDKDIWLYTGWELESILSPAVTDDFNPERNEYLKKRKEAISLCDIVVDGRYIEELRDITLKWRGSSNQQIWKQTYLGEWVNTTEEMG